MCPKTIGDIRKSELKFLSFCKIRVGPDPHTIMDFNNKLFAAAGNGKHEALSELITSLDPHCHYLINVTSQVVVKSKCCFVCLYAL